MLRIVLFSIIFFSHSLYANNLTDSNNNTQLANVQETFLGVYVNGQDSKEVKLFLQMPHELWIAQENFQHWHLHEPPLQYRILYHNNVYYPLSSFTGAEYYIDTHKMNVYLTFMPQSFNLQDISTVDSKNIQPIKPGFGAFMNYDILGQVIKSSYTNTNGIFTPGIFTPDGSFTSGFLINSHSQFSHIVRLNTTWETDLPDSMQSLKIGDSFSTPSMWGNSVGFGGVQWGTNFATNPNFVTFPLPSTRGIAVLPSTLDLYVNNVLTLNHPLMTGPFEINTIPVVSGNGNVRVVTTDLLGRQQSINLPYYASNELLKAGLHNKSVEIGFMRRDFGLQSNNYRQFTAIGTDSWGITNNLTGEWHTELQSSQQNIGIGENYLWGDWGILSSAVAISHHFHHTGQLAQLGFQHQSFSGINFGFNFQTATPDFTQIGLAENQPPPALSSQCFAGFSLKNSASLGISYIQQNTRQSLHLGLLSVSYNQPFFKKWSLSVTTLRTLRGPRNNSIFLTLTRGLDSQTTLSTGVNSQDNDMQANIQLNRSLPLGPGWGYDIYGAQGKTENYYAIISAQNEAGTYSVGAAQQSGLQSYQAEAHGGLAIVGDVPYFTRTLNNSFGVVQIPGYSHVRVYNHHQEVGRTNANGNIFIPDLLPYQENDIDLAPSDLPINVGIKQINIKAVPYARSGLVLNFELENAQNGLITLLQADGQVVPAGAIINMQDNPATDIFVAENGDAYLSHLKIGTNNFTVHWDDQFCLFSLIYVKTADPLPALGTVYCR